MKRSALASILLTLILCPTPGAESKGPGTHQIKLNGHTFTLPVGFEIELAARPPDVKRPIVADFDEEGRLYVADSSGSNENVQQQLQKKPHRILRLEDSDEGRFGRATVFADKMMFPEGVMWYDGSVYVAAPPSIWKLTDTDRDGVADQRSEWLRKTLTNCANDLHGPYLGPDGWIYWCKGAFAKQTYERPGRAPFVTRAAHIFRSRPDGSGIEPVMTGGMDNPVKVVFMPGGERIFTTTFFQHPGGGRRDGLIHAIYGGVYGKDHGPVYEHPWTSPALMPVLTHFGAAAPAGLIRYESTAFGPEYRDNLFAAQFNMHKVSRHILQPQGATFTSRDHDFLVSDNLDFHPTDVIEDADGSLLVIDTGGWYKLCCPSSQLHKPDVLGAIYRVRRKEAARLDDPRGLMLIWSKMKREDLARSLDDERFAVRRKAVQRLAAFGVDAVPALEEVLRSGRSAEARRNAVWAATRIGNVRARECVRKALADPEDTVRQAAIHSISVWRDHDAVTDLLKLLKGPSLHNRRAAAEALGRIGDKAAVPALLDAIGALKAVSGSPDRVLEHSLTFALIEIADNKSTTAGLKSANVLIRRAALTALDQMSGNRLEASAVTGDLTSADASLKETAWWIAGHHPEWGNALASFLKDRLDAKKRTSAERDELVRQLARFCGSKPVQDLVVERLQAASASAEERSIVMGAMAQSGLKEAPAAWLAAVTQALEGDRQLLEAVAVARALRLPKPSSGPSSEGQDKGRKMIVALLKLGQNSGMDQDIRLQALAAPPGGLTDVKNPLFDFLCSKLMLDESVSRRGIAADVLARAKLTVGQLKRLTELLPKTGPMEVNRLLEAFAQTTDEEVGRLLVKVLKNPRVRSNLRVDWVKPVVAKFSPKVQREAEELYVVLNAEAAQQNSKLEQLLGALKDGDVRRGQIVFNSPKAACASCHAIGYLGGKIGPDLTHIAKIRNERDLLESILFPSASFVRSYEPVLVTTKAGKRFNGLVSRETPDEIVLTISATEEERIARADIEEIQPGKVSIMPAGLDQQLTQQELADLVAFLKACK